MNNMINYFVLSLNYEYAKQGVNAVARHQQIGHSGWYVFVDSSEGKETYLVSFEDGQWQFVREFSTEEWNYRYGGGV